MNKHSSRERSTFQSDDPPALSEYMKKKFLFANMDCTLIDISTKEVRGLIETKFQEKCVVPLLPFYYSLPNPRDKFD